ncbi:MAG: hypothetical protein PHU44_08280 [Syntrophales bacterium]|nr:hypothetical protein [Syntrophales bacterium]MDD5641541.1 hypothetical protein [Syntrophales bacterium]
MEMHPFYQVLDPYLIWFYRLTGHAGTNFVIGTLVLAVLCLIIGEATISLTSRFLSKRLGEKTAEAHKYQNLSIDALKAGNKEAYRAANKLANEAFGHTFFQQAALSAAFLWPVFFALAWMQYRFLDLEFPLPVIGWSLGYIGIFVLLYVPALILFKRVKRNLPFYRRPRRLEDIPRLSEPTADNLPGLAEPAPPNGK